MFDVAHGAGLAAIWGSWARYVYRDCVSRFKSFAINVCGVKECEESAKTDEEIALEGIEAMEAFYREIKMPTNLKELGVNPTEEELVEMAHKCALGVDGKKGSIRILYEKDMLEIFRLAN